MDGTSAQEAHKSVHFLDEVHNRHMCREYNQPQDLVGATKVKGIPKLKRYSSVCTGQWAQADKGKALQVLHGCKDAASIVEDSGRCAWVKGKVNIIDNQTESIYL